MTDAVGIALGDVNYVERGGPHGNDGNITKFWEELDPELQGEPWCGAAVSYWEKHAGTPLPAIDHKWGFSYCPDAVNWAKAHGLWRYISTKAQRGWIGFACFDNSGVAEHTFLVIEDLGNEVRTVEGNTSSGTNGSQNNGGGVYVRIRPKSLILGYLQPPTWRQRVTIKIKQLLKPLHSNPYTFSALTIQQGNSGAGVKAIQWAAGMPLNEIDGVFGPFTAKYVSHFQFQHKLKEDAIVGPITLGVLRKIKRRY